MASSTATVFIQLIVLTMRRRPRSTGLRAATSPPHGALVMTSSAIRIIEIQPYHLVVGGQCAAQNLPGQARLGPPASRWRMVRSEQPILAMRS